ncbi:grpE protein homolog, mitochondrial [Anthonomus grandis grandis]|uniref:grpE protein homolog, mitochondrial n=1 Tax=Anthonomus grandis grandis TaxID=2921223 RepID=UPI0021651BB4|nr:grpE protein homolog, mitochondrial [Anthonomus grandis grandis]
MALVSARYLLKCGQSIGESVLFNSRSIAITKVRFNTVEENKKTDSEAPSASPQETKVNEDIERLNKQLSELTQQNVELMDKYKRALADGENLRQRLTKQISEAKIFGIQSFCKDLLEVADVLSKATETVPKDEIKDSNPHLKSLYEGLVMTEAQLKNVFKRHGLEPVNPLNEKFNPNYHEALFQQEVEGKEAGTVVVVSKIGYKLHERVLRPALVGVSK